MDGWIDIYIYINRIDRLLCEWKDIKIDRLIDGSKVTALIQWKGVIYNIPSFIYTFIQTYIYTIIYLFILSYMYSFIYAFIHSFIFH